jgi:subtilisin family serine protease
LPTRVATVAASTSARPPAPDASPPSPTGQWWLAGTTRLTAPDGSTAVEHAVDAIAVWPRTRGRGVVFADIDTGVDPTHPELRGALLKGRGFGLDHWPDLDLSGHGPGVASPIVGRGVKLSGVAPAAKLLELAALDPFGYGGPADLAAALRYTAGRPDVRVVNLPLGIRKACPGVRAAVHANLRAGKLVVAAAGNDGRSAAGTFPCSYRGVLCVGAGEPTGELAPFSNDGPTVVLSAPGDELLTADSTLLHPGQQAGAYETGAGTSFAAASLEALDVLTVER